MRYVVSYKETEHDAYPSRIFSFDVVRLTNIFCIENLRANEGELATMDEASLHMFLGWFLARAEEVAFRALNKLISVETVLPHITEWFVELDYNVLSVNAFGEGRGYRGVKQIQEKGKSEDNKH